MKKQQTIPIAEFPHLSDYYCQRVGDGLSVGYERQTYLTTKEAAEYLRKSESWLTRQPDIPYVRGIPNTYKRDDLDDWFERNKFKPQIAA